MTWKNLEAVRQRAELHRANPHPYRAGGDGIPIVVVEKNVRAGRRIARQLLREDADGITIVAHSGGRGSLVAVITRAHKVHGLLNFVDDDGPQAEALALFRERRRRADGAHALIIVATGRPTSDPHVLGFFECVLRDPEKPLRSARASGKIRLIL